MKTCILISLAVWFTVGVYGQTFYDHYNRGIQQQKRQNLEEAMKCFQDAIKIKEEDGEKIRTYGVNFIDYYPNRELGIIYYEKQDYENARVYLEKSMGSIYSRRAEDYILRIRQMGQTRQSGDETGKNLADMTDRQLTEPGETGPKETESQKPEQQKTGPQEVIAEKKEPETSGPPPDNQPPRIRMATPPISEDQTRTEVPYETKQLDLSGIALDKAGISEILINGDAVRFSKSGIFNARQYLRVGENWINIKATDINKNTTTRTFIVERMAEEPEVEVIAAEDQKTAVPDQSKPTISIMSPPQINFRTLNPVTNDTKEITVSGKIDDQDGIYEVLVNGKDAVLSSTGEFRANVFLRVGTNKIIIEATDIHQNTQVRELTVVREDMVTVARDELMGDQDEYYALIIGISDYRDPQITDLDDLPIRDAEKLANILTTQYTFERENVKLLRNSTRTEILRAFDNLSNTLTDKDNLLIFYAGHGFYDEKTELGYWLPADAEAHFTANWIYNDVLVANLKRIQTKHTLLISDACFSGSIFKTRSMMTNAPMAYQKKYELPSRKAITSGVLKTVPNKSIFLRYLTNRLENYEEKYMSASQLFQSVEIPVANNSPNTPQYGDIQNVGDEGGDFIFIKR